jgi:hypothetical protein
MVIALALAEYGVLQTLADGITSLRVLLEERLREVEPVTWAISVLTMAAVWLLVIRR